MTGIPGYFPILRLLLCWAVLLVPAGLPEMATAFEDNGPAGPPAPPAEAAKPLTEAAQPPEEDFPAWEDIEAVVKEHFGGDARPSRRRRYQIDFLDGHKTYQDGDLITKEDVKPLFSKLNDLGWEIDAGDRMEILSRLLSSSDYLVQQLRTVEGKKLMRKISGHPGGYDRLDRLRRMPHGRYRVKELIRGPDGDLLIEYMTTTKQGKNLGNLLNEAKGGRNFNQPTRRIYTAEQLLKEFEKLFPSDGEAQPQEGRARKREK